ncbi:MAG TPA: hypothetical protein VFO07_13955, partial [Roseiflexaceae bacterium]|nr:hypothetical protein [Roseiflexaceae bacterium]
VQKYTGLPGSVGYIAVALLALLVGSRYVVPWLLTVCSKRLAIGLAIAAWLVLLLAFVLVYPIANAGVVGGGTDRDEALNIAVWESLAGRYPYYPRTYLNAPISPLPGSILLAMPFALLGNSAYQNLFWIAAFYLLIGSYFSDHRVALLVSGTVLALSPLFWQEFLTGGDLLANSLFVCIFTVLFVQAHQFPTSNSAKRIIAAILFGVGLSSRLNYLLLIFPVCSLLWQTHGRRYTLKYMAIICTTVVIVTLPFYIYDPAGFSPLHTLRKVDQFGAYLSFAGPLIVATSALIALLLSIRPLRDDPTAFLLACALPQAIPIMAGLIFYSARGRMDYTFPGYGFSFMWFGILAACMQIMRTSVSYPHPDALKSPSSALR